MRDVTTEAVAIVGMDSYIFPSVFCKALVLSFDQGSSNYVRSYQYVRPFFARKSLAPCQLRTQQPGTYALGILIKLRLKVIAQILELVAQAGQYKQLKKGANEGMAYFTLRPYFLFSLF